MVSQSQVRHPLPGSMLQSVQLPFLFGEYVAKHLLHKVAFEHNSQFIGQETQQFVSLR
jgi:hypothetical protein